MRVTIKFWGGLQVGLYPGPSIASRPFKCSFHDSSIWWQDALGYIILTANTHREKSLFLFSYSASTRKNSDYTSWSHKSIPELIMKQGEWVLCLEGPGYMPFSGRKRGHFSSQTTQNRFSLKNKFWLSDEAWKGTPVGQKLWLPEFTSKKRSDFLSWALRPQEWDSWIYRFLPITLLQPGLHPGDATLSTKVPLGKPLSSPLPALDMPPPTPKQSSSLSVQCWCVMQLYSGGGVPSFQPLETRPSSSWAHLSYSCLHSIPRLSALGAYWPLPQCHFSALYNGPSAATSQV